MADEEYVRGKAVMKKDGAELTRYGHDIQWVNGNYESEMLPDEEGAICIRDIDVALVAAGKGE